MDESGCQMPVFSLDSSFSQDGQLLMNPRTLELNPGTGDHRNQVQMHGVKVSGSEYFKSITDIPVTGSFNHGPVSDYDTIDNGAANGFAPVMSENSLLTLEQLLSDHTPPRQDPQPVLQRSMSNPVSTYSMACDLKTSLVSATGNGSAPELNPVSPSLSEILNQNSVDKYLHDTPSFNHFPGPKSPTIAELLSRACSPTNNGFNSSVSFSNGHLTNDNHLCKPVKMPHEEVMRDTRNEVGAVEYERGNDDSFPNDRSDTPDSYQAEQGGSPSPYRCDRIDSPSPFRENENVQRCERDDPNLMEDDARDEPSIKQDPIDIREYVEVLTTYKCKFCQFNCSDTAIMLSHIQAAHTAEVKKSTQTDTREKTNLADPSFTETTIPIKNCRKKEDLPGTSNKEKVVNKKPKEVRKPNSQGIQESVNEPVVDTVPQTPCLKSPPPEPPRKTVKKRKLTKVKPILPKPRTQLGPPSILGPQSVLGPPPSVFPPPSVHPPSNITMQVEYEPPVPPPIEEPSKESQVFICGVCRAFFLVEEDCSAHVNSVHNSKSGPVQKETEDGIVFGCNLPPCKRTFKTREACEFHISCHMEIRKRPADDEEEYGKVSKAKKTKRVFMCPVDKCKASFQYWQNCAQHAWTEHKIDTGLLCCEECNNYRTMSKFNMKMHKETHNTAPQEKTHICPECSKGFTSKNLLDSHTLNIHHPEKHTCPECGEVKSSSKALQRHSITHQEEKPYSCSVCTFRTKRKHDLDLHEKQQHNPEKAFKCELCSYMTSDGSQMSRHKAMHAKHKKYKCSYCPIAFVQCVNLKSHIEKKHPGLPLKMYKCGQCNFKSRAEEALEKHLRDRKHTAVVEQEVIPEPQSNGNAQTQSAQNIPVNGDQCSLFMGRNGHYPLLVTNGDKVYVVRSLVSGSVNESSNGEVSLTACGLTEVRSSDGLSCGLAFQANPGEVTNSQSDQQSLENYTSKSVSVVLSTDSVIS